MAQSYSTKFQEQSEIHFNAGLNVRLMWEEVISYMIRVDIQLHRRVRSCHRVGLLFYQSIHKSIINHFYPITIIQLKKKILLQDLRKLSFLSASICASHIRQVIKLEACDIVRNDSKVRYFDQHMHRITVRHQKRIYNKCSGTVRDFFKYNTTTIL